MWRLSALLVTVTAFVLAVPLGAAAEPPDGKYVLALGDSATAGTQPIAPAVVLGGSPETQVNRSGSGYADQIVDQLNAEGEKVKLVNLACYYDTTVTMIEGGGLCSYPHGSQLDEALQFLHAHGDHVLAVVMTIGGNDVVIKSGCAFLDFGCYASRLAPMGANLATILTRLRVEDNDVPIAMPNLYNPFLALWFQSPFVAELSNTALITPLAATTAAASAPYDVTVVDTLTAFHTFDFTPGPEGVPVNVATICALSWICTYNDIPLNGDGYAVVAAAVRAALGI